MQSDLLKDIVYNRIKDKIISGYFPLGSKLSEARLTEELNCNKAPIRAALNMLNTEGLVQVKPKSGTYVFNVTNEELNDLLYFRCSIETEALILAYRKNKHSLIQKLSLIYDLMEKTIKENNVSSYLDLDNKFHDTLIEATSNRYFSESFRLISSKMATIKNKLGSNPEHMKRSHRQHLNIIQGLIEDNLEQSVIELKEHILPEHGAYWSKQNIS